MKGRILVLLLFFICLPSFGLTIKSEYPNKMRVYVYSQFSQAVSCFKKDMNPHEYVKMDFEELKPWHPCSKRLNVYYFVQACKGNSIFNCSLLKAVKGDGETSFGCGIFRPEACKKSHS